MDSFGLKFYMTDSKRLYKSFPQKSELLLLQAVTLVSENEL